MSEWFGTSWGALVGLAITATATYTGVIVFTRLAGLRSFSKMSGFDFAMTVAIGSMIATTLLTPEPPLLQALVAIGFVYVLQITVARIRYDHAPFARLVNNEPLLLMDGAEMIEENMRAARVTEDDLRAKLREANVLNLQQVRAVVFESTGDVSVIHSPDPSERFDSDLLDGVRDTR